MIIKLEKQEERLRQPFDQMLNKTRNSVVCSMLDSPVLPVEATCVAVNHMILLFLVF